MSTGQSNNEASTAPKRPIPWGSLLGVYALLGLSGLFIGRAGLLPSQDVEGVMSAGPRVRVGHVLRSLDLQGTDAAWQTLHGDVARVREQLPTDARAIFDLVVAVRGLESEGRADFDTAEQLCRRLSWPRCDRAALELLRERSRP